MNKAITVIARSESDEAIQTALGLEFWIASLALAMTGEGVSYALA
jgi:hypothetical protein